MSRTRRVHVTGIYDVYCGRPGPWGNPFSSVNGTLAKFKTKNREDSVEQFRKWLKFQPELVKRAITELTGKRLACFCKPGEACHVDVWVEVTEHPDRFLPKKGQK
jgi:hypothetical protein